MNVPFEFGLQIWYALHRVISHWKLTRAGICVPVGYLDSRTVLLIASSGVKHCVKLSFYEGAGCTEVFTSLTGIFCLVCMRERCFEY